MTPTLLDLVSKKRPMFEYEREVRVVHYDDAEPPMEVAGYPLRWDAETNVESIRVHPEADDSFLEVVRGVVERYAPALLNRVDWSEMETPPPF